MRHLQATEESHGVQLVREGRAARLEAVHRSLFGKDGDRDSHRDQQQLQQLQLAGRRFGSAAGSTQERPTGSPGRSAAGRSSIELPIQQAGGSPGRPRSLASLPDGSSSASGPSPSRHLGAGSAGTGLQRQPLGGSPGGRSSAVGLEGQEEGGAGSPARLRPSLEAGRLQAMMVPITVPVWLWRMALDTVYGSLYRRQESAAILPTAENLQ